MDITEQYIKHHIAYELLQNSSYELLHIDERSGEIWLEMYDQRTSHIIRLTNHGFDWANELKRDIMTVFQKVMNMGKLLVGKHVQIYNIYVSKYPPVDDWKSFKKPIRLKNKKEMNMNVFYVSQQKCAEEIQNISEMVAPISEFTVNENDYIIQDRLKQYHIYLQNLLITKRKEVKSVFSYGTPFMTYILLLLNISYFLIVEFFGSSMATADLIQFGAKYNPYIIDGEWWRILSAMFLHVGFIHLFMNMLALYYLGIAVEKIYGSTRFFFIYLLAGIGGGLASFALTINISAGASGAIFGLFGALLFFGLHHKKLFLQTMGRGILFLIVFNVFLGFIIPQIDQGAHIGGLLAGFLGAAIVHLPKRKEIGWQFSALIVYLVVSGIITLYGLNNTQNVALYELNQMDALIEDDRYEEVIDLADQTLQQTSNEELQLQLYFQKSYAHLQLMQYDIAIDDLKKCLELVKALKKPQLIEPSYFEEKAYYNLAIAYNEIGDKVAAEEAIEKSYQLNPHHPKIKRLYEKLIKTSP